MDDRIIEKKLSLLRNLSEAESVPLGNWTVRTAVYNAPGDYTYDGNWQTVTFPASFPPKKTVFLKAEIEIPATVNCEESYLAFDFCDMEGMLRIDGDVFCGVDVNHPRIFLPRTGKMELLLEFNSEPRALFEPERARYGFGQFRGASLLRIDRNVENFWYDAMFIWQTTCVIEDERRRKKLQQALETAMLGIDMDLPREELSREAAAALKKFREEVAQIAPDPESGTLCGAGHTHIDTAWLWPLKETVRKCSRTFSTACRYMEHFPDYHFSCSQAQLYAYTQEHYPELFEEIRKHVRSGRWENTGAMWVEPDCNVPNGESLIRQVLYGLEFYRKEFNTRPELCWLPDVFGYPASLPEILVSCGIRYFSTNKLHWQAKEPFPYHLFSWKGLDGSEILSHIAKLPNFYNGFLEPEQLYPAWKNYEQKALYDELLYPFGYGDGGGGVTEEMMEMVERAKKHVPGLPGFRVDTVEGFFHRVEEKAPALPVWDGELYLQTHRGTYTTHSEVKKANRISETLLRDAEILGEMAKVRSSCELPPLENAWKTMLLNQFHDILPGSSITEIYPRCLADYEEVKHTARSRIDAALRALNGGTGSALRVFNTLSWERHDPVFADIASPGTSALEALDSQGNRYPVQILEDDGKRARIVFAGAAIPPAGYADFKLRTTAAAPAVMDISARKMENASLLVELSANGEVSRIYDKCNARELLPEGTFAGELQLFQDGPEDEDAWNIHDTATKRRYPFDRDVKISVRENGPVRGVIRIERTRNRSKFTQDIILYANSSRLDFNMAIDWQERNTVLKLAFPIDVRTTRSTCEVQFGALERPTHTNTVLDQQKFEIPLQRWADLSEDGYGAAVLNDSRYGCDARGNMIRMTLLRGTIHPDPVADIGFHETACALLPHAGNWTQGEVVRRAWEYNTPCTVSALEEEAVSELVSFMELSGHAGCVLQTLKAAEDGRGRILRFYEANGGRGKVSVKTALPFNRVIECNSVEEDIAPAEMSGDTFTFTIKPYQIRSFRLLD
ncbi:MAG: alpha-mannosidase [Lentisphaeria bacterium]|nr:alpha-mannosidase [Lentisphaeria bacterium]